MSKTTWVANGCGDKVSNETCVNIDMPDGTIRDICPRCATRRLRRLDGQLAAANARADAAEAETERLRIYERLHKSECAPFTLWAQDYFGSTCGALGAKRAWRRKGAAFAG